MATAETDRWGAPVQSGSGAGLTHFDNAVESLVTLRGDPLVAADAAVRADDELVLGHILRAYLSMYSTSAEGVRRAAKILEPLENTDSTLSERELLHLRTARSWVAGEWDSAAHFLERALLHNSHDLLALKVAQDLYFLLGETKELQGVVRRVLRAWSAERSGWGYVQGMYAFGLEENGDYAQAEVFARAALHCNPCDIWAVHALAHVLEMQGRPRDGIAFLTEATPEWAPSYFATHLWWHLALYHLTLGEIELAVSLYDGPIRGDRSAEWLDLIDAAGLLWRLSLFGVDIGLRASELTADIEPLIDEPTYIFNDWHAVMAFGMAGRHDLTERLLTSNRRRTHGTNRAVAEQAGLALLEGFDSFAAGRFRRAIDILTHTRPIASVVGGSHAQRDIIALTIIAATARVGDGLAAQDLPYTEGRSLNATNQ